MGNNVKYVWKAATGTAAAGATHSKSQVQVVTCTLQHHSHGIADGSSDPSYAVNDRVRKLDVT